MNCVLAALLLVPQSVLVPDEPGLYYAEANHFTRVEGRAVTLVESGGHIPLKGSLPLAGSSGTKAQILGESAELKVTPTPVFYFRPAKDNEASGAGDLVLIKLKRRKHCREFEVSSKPDWKASSGIPLKAQVRYYSRQVERGLYKLFPAEDLDPGEYGFYLYRGRDLPGLIYDFAVE
jgi:hypothetical protein